MIKNDRLLIHFCLTLNLDQRGGGWYYFIQNLLGVEILRVKEGEHKIYKLQKWNYRPISQLTHNVNITLFFGCVYVGVILTYILRKYNVGKLRRTKRFHNVIEKRSYNVKNTLHFQICYI